MLLYLELIGNTFFKWCRVRESNPISPKAMDLQSTPALQLRRPYKIYLYSPGCRTTQSTGISPVQAPCIHREAGVATQSFSPTCHTTNPAHAKRKPDPRGMEPLSRCRSPIGGIMRFFAECLKGLGHSTLPRTQVLVFPSVFICAPDSR